MLSALQTDISSSDIGFIVAGCHTVWYFYYHNYLLYLELDVHADLNPCPAEPGYTLPLQTV